MPFSIANGEHGDTILAKINGLFGIESGALADPWELTFDTYQRYRTLLVNEDIELGLASTGKVAQSFETLTTTGDGSHLLTFPADWILLGDSFNFDKVQEIAFRWTGAYVIGVITTLDDLPDASAPTLTSATLADGTEDTLDLVFNEAVTITTAGWTVTASGGAVTVSAVLSGSGTTTPKFTLSRVIVGTETVTVSYDPGTGATTDLSSNELATITNAAVTNNIVTTLLEELFTGTTVDTAKGTITNPDSANLTISQNNKLLFTRTTDTAVASSVTNFWQSTNTYTRGTFAVLMNRDVGYTNGLTFFQYRVDANNDIAILQNVTTPGTVDLRVRSGGSTVYTLATGISSNNRFRIRYSAAHEIIFEYRNGSVWTQLGTTQTFNIGAAGNIKCGSNSNVSDVAADVFSFDSIYVTDKVYSAATP